MPHLSLGRTVATPSIAGLTQSNDAFQQFIQKSMQRHELGDWGECSPEDTLANNQALENGARILSVYKLPPHLREQTGIPKIWILTEADRSATIVMQPGEY